MSELIKKIAKQAWYQDLKEKDPNWKPREGRGSERFMSVLGGTFEKFAELIIKECAEQLDDGTEEGGRVRNVLSKHFGIENES